MNEQVELIKKNAHLVIDQLGRLSDVKFSWMATLRRCELRLEQRVCRLGRGLHRTSTRSARLWLDCR